MDVGQLQLMDAALGSNINVMQNWIFLYLYFQPRSYPSRTLPSNLY